MMIIQHRAAPCSHVGRGNTFFFLGRRRESRNVVAFFLFFSQFLIFKYQLLILKIGCLNHQWNREDCSETARKRPLKCPDMKAFPTLRERFRLVRVQKEDERCWRLPKNCSLKIHARLAASRLLRGRSETALKRPVERDDEINRSEASNQWEGNGRMKRKLSYKVALKKRAITMTSTIAPTTWLFLIGRRIRTCHSQTASSQPANYHA